MKYLALISVLLLGACTNVPERPLVDPSWPTPIAEYKAEWKVIVVDGKAFVGMPFDESQEFRIWLDDIGRYVKDSNGVICFYREHLNEAKCK